MGSLAEGLFRLGIRAEARMRATMGLQAAVRMGDRYEQGSFLGDLGDIDEASGDLKSAVERYIEAAARMQECGSMESVGSCYVKALRVAVALADWDRIGEIAGSLLISLLSMPPQVRARIVGALLGILRDAAKDVPGAGRRDGLAMVNAVCGEILEIDEGVQDIQVVQMATAALVLWLDGSKSAAEVAEQLDERCRGDVSWSDFVKQRPR
jgi:hypothetical protein